MKYKQIVNKNSFGVRLDKVLLEYLPNVSRSYIKYLIENDRVRVNNSFEKPSFKVKEKDIVEWEDFEKKPFKTKKKLKIIFQSQDLVVIDKPVGIAVHLQKTKKPQKEATIVDILMNEFPELKKIGGERPGVVHRLDKNTSGLLVVAKNKKTADYLKKAFKERRIKKAYEALILGKLEPKEGIIDAPIGRSFKNRTKMAVVSLDEGRKAITEYKVLEYLPPGKDTYSLVQVRPLTGRTHQIRVHFASIGHPIVGDKVYGSKKQKESLGRQFLHASSLGFKLPGGEYKEFRSRLPNDLRNFLERLKN